HLGSQHGGAGMATQGQVVVVGEGVVGATRAEVAPESEPAQGAESLVVNEVRCVQSLLGELLAQVDQRLLGECVDEYGGVDDDQRRSRSLRTMSTDDAELDSERASTRERTSARSGVAAS